VELSLEQRIAINLRLSQRLLVEVGKSVGSVGLSGHMKTRHAPCHRRAELVRIDYHSDTRDDRDFIQGCPAQYFDARLHSMVYRVIEIESLGGLPAWTRTPIAHLPSRLVWFVKTTLAARDRLIAERDALRIKLSR
jgi:hypothetical protein